MRVLNRMTGALITGVVAILAVGCGDSRVTDVCEEAEQCGGTLFIGEVDNDEQLEVCEIRGQRIADQASDYGCDDEWDAYADCFVENAKCDNDIYAPDTDDCDKEAEDVNDCVKKASDDDLHEGGLGLPE